MNESYTLYNGWESGHQLKLSSSMSSDQNTPGSSPVVRLVINWINNLLEDEPHQKISCLQDLTNGQIFLKIIRTRLENQSFSSVYNARVNYSLIKKYFKEKFLLSDEILYELAIHGDEQELAKIALTLMLKSEKVNTQTDLDLELVYALKKTYNNKGHLNVVQIIQEFLNYTSIDCENLGEEIWANTAKIAIKTNEKIDLMTEIVHLKKQLSEEKIKNESILNLNNQMQAKITEVNQLLYTEEVGHKKMKIKNREFRNLIKAYSEQLIQCKKTIDYLSDDYQLINSELATMKDQIERKNEKESAAKRFKSSNGCKSTKELAANDQLLKENIRLKKTNKHYKSKYLDLKKHVIMELNSTVDDITRKNESILYGNAEKLKQYEQDMEVNLKRFKEKHSVQCVEMDNLEIDCVAARTESMGMQKELDTRNMKIKKLEASNSEMLSFIKIQGEEMLGLDERLREAKQENQFLDVKIKKMAINTAGFTDSNEKQIKELYDTITEVFIERIEELKKENGQLKNENRILDGTEP